MPSSSSWAGTLLNLLALAVAEASLLAPWSLFAQQPGSLPSSPLFPGLPQPSLLSPVPLVPPALPAPPVSLPGVTSPNGEALPLPDLGLRRMVEELRQQVESTGNSQPVSPAKTSEQAESGTESVTEESAEQDTADSEQDAAGSEQDTAGSERTSTELATPKNTADSGQAATEPSAHDATGSDQAITEPTEPASTGTMQAVATEPTESREPTESSTAGTPQATTESAEPITADVALPLIQLPPLPEMPSLPKELQLQPLRVLPLPTLQNCRNAGVPIPEEASLLRQPMGLGLFQATKVDASQVKEDIQPTDTKPLRDMNSEELSELFGE